eukprot:TRINITY_DN628_c0_g1_i4.p1 TRINITY_DN628_c0_g1~~TRINITY_DN628_c0_g1_i4.p1  ORF type:complete len:336 (-),score=52.08 TRINITY_DN628_c0_g1_i4:175-1122(-)
MAPMWDKTSIGDAWAKAGDAWTTVESRASSFVSSLPSMPTVPVPFTLELPLPIALTVDSCQENSSSVYCVAGGCAGAVVVVVAVYAGYRWITRRSSKQQQHQRQQQRRQQQQQQHSERAVAVRGSLVNRLILSLPRWVGSLIGRALFLPTLFFNVVCHYYYGGGLRHAWWSRIDDTVILGALPFSSDVPTLVSDEAVCGVINTCDEYAGPTELYKELAIEQLRLPTIDYVAPSLVDVDAGLAFIAKYEKRGGSVYVHCKAGKGRSATIVMCYLMKKEGLTREQAQKRILAARPQASQRLWCRPVVIEFERRLLEG